ncbi:MAG: hypothetical protein R3310_14970 [Candidatus Competibacteraceae bacterium]|nr:hypothetical protein [Candidatus Competibacteraceae bacterium]
MPVKAWLGPLLSALAITAALVAGLIYFVVELWPRLPAGWALVGFILLAVLVIGYPIWALARWSNRYLEKQRRQ